MHTYWVGNLRLVLDVQLSPGKQHTSVHAKAGLAWLLDELGGLKELVVVLQKEFEIFKVGRRFHNCAQRAAPWG